MGSALERYSTYQDSIEAKTNGLTAAIESLSTNIISEDLYSGIIQATTGVVEFLDKTNLLKASLTGLVAMGVSKAFVSMGAGIITAYQSTAKLTAAMALFDKGRSTENLLEIGLACKGLSDQQLKLVLSTKGLNHTQRLQILTGMGVAEAEREQTLTTLGLAAAEDKATASSFSLKGAWNALKVTFAGTPAKLATTAITATILAVKGAIAVVKAFEQAEKKESDAAEELYNKSKERAESNKEETKSLDELIKKYKELKSKSTSDSDTREEIKNIQYDIVDLVGSEAKTLDIVNGSLDEQLKKLKEITVEKSKQNVQDARDAYDNAVYKSDVMVGNSDDYGNDVSVKWTDAESAQIHKVDGFEHITYDDFVKYISDKGFGDIFRKNNDETLMNMRFVVDTTGIDGLEEKIARLKEFKEFLAENGFRSTGIYQGVNEAIGQYEEQKNNELESANNLADSIINDFSISNAKLKEITVDSVDTFEEYRQRMLTEAKNDESIGKLLADGVISEDDLEIAVNNFMATAVQFSDWYEQWQKNINGVSTNSLSFTGFTESESKSIDDFQSKVKTLGDALASIQSGDASGITDLVQEFPELAGQSGDLEQAIIDLINNALAELYEILGKNLPTNVKDDLKSIADEATGVVPDLNEAFSAIQKSYDTMHEFKNAMDTGKLTDSILSNAGALSSYINQMVAGFHAGAVTADQLYNALTEHYNNDLINYGNALIAKNQYSEEFYTAVGLANTEVVNQFMKDYGIDLKNCKSYNEAKLKIEEQTLKSVSKAWSQYYRVQYDSQSDAAYAALQESAAHGDGMAQAQIAAIQVQRDKYQSAMDALNKITYDGISSNFSNITSKIDTTSEVL